MKEDELEEVKNEYEALEQSWREENEKFIQFQLIANRDLQLMNHVLTEDQKVQLRSISVKRQIEQDRLSVAPSEFPHSDSLEEDDFELIKVSSDEKLRRTLEEKRTQLAVIKSGKLHFDNQEALKNSWDYEKQILKSQLVELRKRRENLSIATQRADSLLPHVKQSCLHQMNLSHMVGYPKPIEELCSIGIILNSTFNDLEEKIEQLNSEQLPETKRISSSPHVETKEDLLKEIAAERAIQEFRRKVLKKNNELLQEKSDNLVKSVSLQTTKHSEEIEALKIELRGLQNSSSSAIKLKYDALTRSSASALEVMDSAIVSLTKELSKYKVFEDDRLVPHPDAPHPLFNS